MKAIDRYRLAYERKEADRVPFWFEMEGKGAQLAGMPWKDYMQNPKRIASASIKAAKWFGMDLIFVLCNGYYPQSGWGTKFKWREDPRFGPDIAEWVINETEDYEKLEVMDPKRDGMMPQVMKAVELISDEVGDEYPIQLFTFSDLDLLYGGLAPPQRMGDLILEPDAVHKALKAINETQKEIMRALVDAGGTHWELIDIHANPDQLSVKQFEEFTLPYDHGLFREARKTGLSPMLCLNTPNEKYWDSLVGPGKNYLDALRIDYKKSGAPLEGVDWKSSLRHWKEKYGKDFCLITGPDAITICLMYAPEQLEDFSKEMLEIMAPGGGFILGVLGCCSPEMTDENLFAVRRAIDKYGTYPRGK